MAVTTHKKLNACSTFFLNKTPRAAMMNTKVGKIILDNELTLPSIGLVILTKAHRGIRYTGETDNSTFVILAAPLYYTL